MKDGCMRLKQQQWKLNEQILFLKRLGMLLEEGYSISDAIRFIKIQLSKNKHAPLSKSIEQLKNGEKFYTVLNQLLFHSTAVSFIYYGERNGQLSRSLQTASIILLEREKRKEKIKKLLMYPIFLLVVTGMMFFVISWQLLPQFAQLYDSFQAEPNNLIKLFYWIYEHPKLITITTLSILTVAFYSFFTFKKKRTSYEIQFTLGKIPVIGDLVRLWNTYYIAYHTSQLLSGGLSLSQSLSFIKDDPEKPYLAEAIEKINKRLLEGESLASAVGEIPIWKKELVAVIEHGQLSGKLEIELNAYSQYCLELFFDYLEKVIKFIQPLIFSFIALWIIIMYFSIMLPSFQLINYV